MQGADARCWDELLPDALGLIFKQLTLQELLTVVPQVCKSWRKVVMGSYCWQEIDIEEWSKNSDPDHVHRMLQMLITRSSGSLQKLSVSRLRNELGFSLIAENAPSLRILRLPRCCANDLIMEPIARRLSMLTFLDLSYCNKIGPTSLQTIGKHCNLLVRFCRNMHPVEREGKLSQNDEAAAIANAFPKLKHLEIAYLLVDSIAVSDIIRGCPELEFLDVRGCWDVRLNENHLKDKFPKLEVLGPQVIDNYGENFWDECSDSSESFYEYESSEGMWDDGERLDELELSFYNGFHEVSVNGWPPSP